MDEQDIKDMLDDVKRFKCLHCGAMTRCPLKFLQQYKGEELMLKCESCRQHFPIHA